MTSKNEVIELINQSSISNWNRIEDLNSNNVRTTHVYDKNIELCIKTIMTQEENYNPDWGMMNILINHNQCN